MSWIQCERLIDLPRLIGMAWKTPVGWREYSFSAVKKGVLKRAWTPRRMFRCSSMKVFLIVEDPPAASRGPAGDVLDRAVGDEVGVEFGADLADQPAELGAVVAGVELVDILLRADAAELLGEER